MCKKVLVLAAHLDDSIIAAGGLIRKFVKTGFELNVVCFGNGDEAYTIPGGSAAAVKSFKQEAAAAHKLLWVSSFECFYVPDLPCSKIGVKYAEVLKQSFFIPRTITNLTELF